MEFGKTDKISLSKKKAIANAKKAMKLHHREGITLKQAWKIVKSKAPPKKRKTTMSPKKRKTKTSPKKRKTTMSPKKRKAVSKAKKAMNLHHREGITLKQAWRRVNRFGGEDDIVSVGRIITPPASFAPPSWISTRNALMFDIKDNVSDGSNLFSTRDAVQALWRSMMGYTPEPPRGEFYPNEMIVVRAKPAPQMKSRKTFMSSFFAPGAPATASALEMSDNDIYFFIELARLTMRGQPDGTDATGYISQGTYNIAMKTITPDKIPTTQNIHTKAVRDGWDDFPKSSVFRFSVPDNLPTLDSAVRELITAGFAATNNLGPALYGGFILPNNSPPFYKFDIQRNSIEWKKTIDRADFMETRVKLCMFLEAWEGDVYNGILAKWFTGEEKFSPTEFAKKFVDLLDRSHKAGLLLLDAKPGNMLWRKVGQELELCWTDFDYQFTFMRHSNNNKTLCDVLIHAALIVGGISCELGKYASPEYGREILKELEKKFKISTIKPKDMCDWLNEAEILLFRSGMVPPEHWKRIGFPSIARGEQFAENLLRTMFNYLTYEEGRTKEAGYECLVGDVVEGVRPNIFSHMINFALFKMEPKFPKTNTNFGKNCKKRR